MTCVAWRGTDTWPKPRIPRNVKRQQQQLFSFHLRLSGTSLWWLKPTERWNADPLNVFRAQPFLLFQQHITCTSVTLCTSGIPQVILVGLSTYGSVLYEVFSNELQLQQDAINQWPWWIIINALLSTTRYMSYSQVPFLQRLCTASRMGSSCRKII